MNIAYKLKRKPWCYIVTSTLEIDSIYVAGGDIIPGLYKKEVLHDYVKQGGIIYVNIPDYPKLIAATSARGEKYVRSAPNDTPNDNLLKLPCI
ncbi:DUF3892 domain-containing protein [Akkermansia sp. N21116]|jgi:hypothetical protein|uniref:DUF3892 domain-containing protein n=1 Tax=Akkermansia sp. N21116 TaxID=3040764 RepID=UPI00244E88C6|nr:DUF3892 domain-containing protein [Akkermansia sp. N21116]WPX40995.1 DUF3892 domain-containing protein [Akkermansia sp. N21116]